MGLVKAIQHALNGDAILFLGSGASFGAKNIMGNDIISSGQLADLIYPDCENLTQAVDLFLAQSKTRMDNELKLIEILRNEFICKEITGEQLYLSSIPWKRIYTTNYDNIMELSYNKSGKRIKSVSMKNEASANCDSQNTLCVHINGYIYDLEREDLKRTFKLSSVSYNTEDFSKNEWGNLFISDLSTYEKVIFIGFSMNYDLDIRRFVSQISKDKCIFIVKNDENPNNILLLQQYGEVYNIGLEGLVSKIKEVAATYIPIQEKTLENTYLTNFKSITKFNPIFTKPSDQDVLKYYINGKRIDGLYYEENNKYMGVVKRRCVDNIIKDIENGDKAIFIHSDIGNGKTEVVEQLARHLSRNYKVFLLVDNNEKISQEIELICQSQEKIVVIIENFYNFYEVFRNFKVFDGGNITYIFSARTSIYKSRYEAFEIGQIKTYDLNRLNYNEIKDLSNVFKRYGYYFRENTDTQKHIADKCNKKLQSVVLSMFDNEEIATNILSATESVLNKNYTYYNLIIFLIIIKVMSLDLNFYDALTLTKSQSVDYDFERNFGIAELMDVQNKQYEIKSVALCVWILKNKNIIGDVIDTLIGCAEVADISHSINKKYSNFLGNIISYKHLRFILETLDVGDEEKIKIINEFYERIKNLAYYNNKYYFWLQYAISAIEVKDFQGAEMHFRAAYATLPKKMQPFEINNQYARLKIELMLLDSYKYNSTTLDEIVKIDDLLTPTSAEADDQYYCYKVADAYYGKIFEKFYEEMNENEQDRLKEIVKNKYNSCISYSRLTENFGFKNYMEIFAQNFLYLSVYNTDQKTDFYITNTKGPHLFGYIIYNSKRENAHAMYHGNSRRDQLRKKIVKAKIINYNNNFNTWELELL